MRLTKAQVAGLRLLSDGQSHETTKNTCGHWIGGRVAQGLVKRGLAVACRVHSGASFVMITEAGRNALSSNKGTT
jgi:hypothetical protein